jgi:hypothetical protein
MGEGVGRELQPRGRPREMGAILVAAGRSALRSAAQARMGAWRRRRFSESGGTGDLRERCTSTACASASCRSTSYHCAEDTFGAIHETASCSFVARRSP